MGKYLKVLLPFLVIMLFAHFSALADAVMGNTSANLNGDGIAARSSDWLFYAADGIWKMRSDGTDRQKISSLDGYDINVIDGWVYFVLTSDLNSHGFYRVTTSGTDEEQLYNGLIDSPLYAYGDWLYYVDSDTGALIRMSLDGSKTERIGDKPCGRLMIHDGILYATWRQEDNETSETGCNKYSLPDLTELSTCDQQPDFGDGDWLYWYDGAFKRMDKTGSQTEELENIYYSLNAKDGVLYSKDMRGQLTGGLVPLTVGHIHQYDPSTGEDITLVEGYCYNLNVVDDWLFYGAYDEADKSLRSYAYQFSSKNTIKLD